MTDLPQIKQLLTGKRYLQNVKILDSLDRSVWEASFDKNGDTSSVNWYRYNQWGKQCFFHNEWRGDMAASWDIYGVFDYEGNEIQSIRLESQGEVVDTTEVYTYTYGPNHTLLSEVRYNKTRFQYKATYRYNAQDQLVEQCDYVHKPDEMSFRNVYEYDAQGNRTKETTYDLKLDKNKPKRVYDTKYTYWK